MIPLACPHCDNELDILSSYDFDLESDESLEDNIDFDRMASANIGDYDCPHCNKPFETTIEHVEIEAYVKIAIKKELTEADKKYIEWQKAKENEKS